MQTERVKVSDIIILKEREERDPNGIKDLADSINTVGYLLHPPVLHRDEKNNLLVAAGRRRVKAIRLLGWEYVDAFILELEPARAELIRVIENSDRLELTALEKAEHAKQRIQYLVKLGVIKDLKSNLSSKKREGSSIRDLEEAIGIPRATLNRQLKIAGISEAAIEKIRGTPLEDNQDVLLKISEVQKDHHVRLVSGLLSNLTFEQALAKIEKLELKGKDWPDEQNDTFTRMRKELFSLINQTNVVRNKVTSTLAKYKNKKGRNQVYQLSLELKNLFLEIEDEIKRNLPSGPCPYCDFEGCEECMYDGYAGMKLLVDFAGKMERGEIEKQKIKHYHF